MFTGKTYISKALKCYCTFKCKLHFIVVAIFSGIHVCVFHHMLSNIRKKNEREKYAEFFFAT